MAVGTNGVPQDANAMKEWVHRAHQEKVYLPKRGKPRNIVHVKGKLEDYLEYDVVRRNGNQGNLTRRALDVGQIAGFCKEHTSAIVIGLTDSLSAYNRKKRSPTKAVDIKVIREIWQSEKPLLIKAIKDAAEKGLIDPSLKNIKCSLDTVNAIKKESKNPLAEAIANGYEDAVRALITALQIKGVSEEEIMALDRAPHDERRRFEAILYNNIHGYQKDVTRIIKDAARKNNEELLYTLQLCDCKTKDDKSPYDIVSVKSPMKAKLLLVKKFYDDELSDKAKDKAIKEAIEQLDEPLLAAMQKYKLTNSQDLSPLQVIAKMSETELTRGVKNIVKTLVHECRKEDLCLNDEVSSFIIKIAIEDNDKELLLHLQKTGIQTSKANDAFSEILKLAPEKLTLPLKSALLKMLQTFSKDELNIDASTVSQLTRLALQTCDVEILSFLHKANWKGLLPLLHEIAGLSLEKMKPEIEAFAKKIIQDEEASELHKRVSQSQPLKNLSAFDLAFLNGHVGILKAFIDASKVDLREVNQEGNSIFHIISKLPPSFARMDECLKSLDLVSPYLQVSDLTQANKKDETAFQIANQSLLEEESQLSDYEDKLAEKKQCLTEANETIERLKTLDESSLSAKQKEELKEAQENEIHLKPEIEDLSKIITAKKARTEYYQKLLNNFYACGLVLNKEFQITGPQTVQILLQNRYPKETVFFIIKRFKDAIDKKSTDGFQRAIQEVVKAYQAHIDKGMKPSDALKTAYVEGLFLKGDVQFEKIRDLVRFYDMPKEMVDQVVAKCREALSTLDVGQKEDLEKILGFFDGFAQEIEMQKIKPIDALRVAFLFEYEAVKVKRKVGYFFAKKVKELEHFDELKLASNLKLFKDERFIYVITRKLGEGTYKLAEQVAKIAYNPESSAKKIDALVRLTLLPSDRQNEELLELAKEIRIANEIQGQGVVSIHEVRSLPLSSDPQDVAKLIEIVKKKGVLVEPCVGDLKAWLKTQKTDVSDKLYLAKLQARYRAFQDFLLGLSRLHSKGFVWADAKPENCMVAYDEKGELHFKIHDFGTTFQTTETPFASFELHKYATPAHSSRELLAKEKITDYQATDMWPCANILNLLTDFEELGWIELYHPEKSTHDDFDRWRVDAIDERLKALRQTQGRSLREEVELIKLELLERFLEPDPQKRVKAEEAIELIGQAEAKISAL